MSHPNQAQYSRVKDFYPLSSTFLPQPELMAFPANLAVIPAPMSQDLAAVVMWISEEGIKILC